MAVETAADATPPDGPVVGQVGCSTASALVAHVRSTMGEDAVGELVERAAVPYTAAFLEDIGNWIWHEDLVALFRTAAELTGDDRVGIRVGELMVRRHSGTPVATLLRSLGSPEAVFGQLTLAVTKFSTVTEAEPTGVEPGRATVRVRALHGYARDAHMCDLTRGTLSQPPVLFGLPAATVEESECQARGSEQCVYTVTWDAERAAGAADPQNLVTALEAQLAAMQERLDTMYATARDLITSEHLDAALARIINRAATAVRAPRYLLAVRTRPGEPARFQHRGFSDAEARQVADVLLGDGGRKDPSWLVADVASATRHYGRLMAASPSGAFFPAERRLLSVYATYAATVLDTATALDDARRNGERSRALLELSMAIAAASTREEVAQRMADSVPAVVDCDRVGVFLWSDDPGTLVCEAITGLPGDLRAPLRDLRIHGHHSRHLAGAVDNADPTPVFFDLGTRDEFVAALMRRFGSSALIVVPIVANARFYGVLTVSATDRPDRLESSDDLLDRLRGVVAQAATSLDNARLMETMAHQARHDNLTGLLGHRAFHESLEAGLGGGAADSLFTLASVDIDDFKQINDRFGHPVGDEALRCVAAALRSSVREEDEVFRVGGEEFAVLLPGLTAPDAVPVADRLRAAVAAVDFRVPLRVSIGLATWPHDAADRDDLLERADAALYTAKRAGKDRTALNSAAS